MAVSRVRAVSVPWDSQPQEWAQPDWSKAITESALVIESGALSFTPQGVTTLAIAAGSPTIAPSIAGVGPTFTSGAQRFTSSQVPAFASTDGFTIEVLCAITAAPSLAGFFGAPERSGFGSAKEARGMLAFSGGSNRNIYFWSGAGDLASGVDWRVDGSLQHVFITSDAGASSPMKFYRDGALIASGTTPAALAARPASTEKWITGDMNATWNSVPTGTLFKRAFYRRALSATEIAELTGNAWKGFVDQQILVPVTSAVSAWWPGNESTLNGWTSSNGGTLASCIAETTFSDAEWIEGPVGSNTPNFPWAPSSLPAGNYDFPVRAYKPGATGQIRSVFLDSGGAALATGAWHALTGGYANYSDNLTIAATSTHFRLETQA